MPKHLTESAIAKGVKAAALSRKRSDLADAGCPGLRLRVTPAGSKTWVLCCRDRLGRMRKFPIGAYPDIGVSEARTEARALHTRVKRDGADPVADRRRDLAIGRDAKAGINTLAAVLKIYETHRGNSLKSWPHSRKRVDLVFGSLMDRPAAMLTASDLQMAADGYPKKQSAAFALRTIRPALKWLIQRKHLPAGVAELHAPATVKARTRVLSRKELAAILPVLSKSAGPHAAVLRFLLLTLARLNEATGIQWKDIDLEAKTWTLAQTKNRQPHVIPLSGQALQILQDKKPEKAKPEALVFANAAGAPLENWDRVTKAFMKTSKTSGWHRHDLRRTGATMLGEMGELPDIIEAALNHVSIRSPIAATYNRSRYRPQVAAALQRLADRLDEIQAEGAADAIRKDAA